MEYTRPMDSKLYHQALGHTHDYLVTMTAKKTPN